METGVFRGQRADGIDAMDRLEILVEEPSIAEVLKTILPKVLPDGWAVGENCFVRPHEGKQDLRASIPRKMRVAGNKDYETGFIIVHDQDANDCRRLKAELVELCADAQIAGFPPFKVRIVCRELESWYWGDMDAIEHVFPRFRAAKYRNKKQFRQPDACVSPKHELKRIVGEYPQIATARDLAAHMDVLANKSQSFRCFIACVKQMLGN